MSSLSLFSPLNILLLVCSLYWCMCDSHHRYVLRPPRPLRCPCLFQPPDSHPSGNHRALRQPDNIRVPPVQQHQQDWGWRYHRWRHDLVVFVFVFPYIMSRWYARDYLLLVYICFNWLDNRYLRRNKIVSWYYFPFPQNNNNMKDWKEDTFPFTITPWRTWKRMCSDPSWKPEPHSTYMVNNYDIMLISLSYCWMVDREGWNRWNGKFHGKYYG